MADDGSTTKQAATEGESGVHRLRDIVVEEVSLVDRAANKRRFLLVKRSSQMADDGKPKSGGTSQEGRTGATAGAGARKPRLKPDENVDKARPRVMRAASDDDDEEEEETDAKRARGRDSSEDDDEEDEEEASKATSEDDEEGEEDDEDDEEDDEKKTSTKTSKTRARAKADARSNDGARVGTGKGRDGKSAQKADDELVLPGAVKNAVLRVLAQALERLMAVTNQVKEAGEPDDGTDASVPDDVTSELEDIGELLEDVGEQLADPAEKAAAKRPAAAKARAAKAGVAKAGRRMAKDRLERFQKALEALSAILKELVAAKEAPGAIAGARPSPQVKRDVVPEMRELAAGVSELTRVVKRQEQEIVRLRKTPGTSNAIPIEGGSRRREVLDVSWPLDMNRPISRDSVAKAVSFYDEE
jgi:hypothetical protein